MCFEHWNFRRRGVWRRDGLLDRDRGWEYIEVLPWLYQGFVKIDHRRFYCLFLRCLHNGLPSLGVVFLCRIGDNAVITPSPPSAEALQEPFEWSLSHLDRCIFYATNASLLVVP